MSTGHTDGDDAHWPTLTRLADVELDTADERRYPQTASPRPAARGPAQGHATGGPTMVRSVEDASDREKGMVKHQGRPQSAPPDRGSPSRTGYIYRQPEGLTRSGVRWRARRPSCRRFN
jgi:hypothetical protein